VKNSESRNRAGSSGSLSSIGPLPVSNDWIGIDLRKSVHGPEIYTKRRLIIKKRKGRKWAYSSVSQSSRERQGRDELHERCPTVSHHWPVLVSDQSDETWRDQRRSLERSKCDSPTVPF
jgi:hypothetical protein